MNNKADEKEHARGMAEKILRFRKSERLLHWSLAVPFLVCLASAIVLFAYYNPDPTRPYRALFGVIHRVAGLSLIVLPLLAILLKWDFRTHLYNIRQAFCWTLDDFKWLSLMGLAAINKKIKLPEQGKFNAAEKINFIYLMASYPLYIITGFLIWETDAAFSAWALHVGLAVGCLPLIGGHLFMATINPESRVGLTGMFTGYVDRHWAKHHYGKWFHEHFSSERKVTPINTVKRTAENKKPDVHSKKKFKKSA